MIILPRSDVVIKMAVSAFVRSKTKRRKQKPLLKTRAIYIECLLDFRESHLYLKLYRGQELGLALRSFLGVTVSSTYLFTLKQLSRRFQ